MKARLLSELKSVLPGLVDPLRLAAVSGSVHDPRRNQHLEAAFRGTERTGLMLAILVRFAIIIGLVLFFALTSPMLGDGFGVLLVTLFGTAQMATFTVIGDTVNVANRIQELTKEKKCSLAASAALVEAVRCENSKDGWTFLRLLEAAGPSHLRGRDAPIDVFVLAQKPAEARTPVAHNESVT